MSVSRIHSTARSLLQSSSARSQSRPNFHNPHIARQHQSRLFHASTPLLVIRPYLLADIGEGITECQIIQWFVQPGARVAQFDKICEVQSDKAAVEITSRFDGVIKKLHYEADDMAKVGSPLVDIDIQGEISEEDEGLTKVESEKVEEEKTTSPEAESPSKVQQEWKQPAEIPARTLGKHASLATPAVRHLTKELNIEITDVSGTGKDGRVLKEDVQRHADAKRAGASSTPGPAPSEPLGEDKIVQLSPIQKKMYQIMTHSLTIPHFLYADNTDFTSLNRVRKTLNAQASNPEASPRLSALPFIIKAVSLSLSQFPSLNSHLEAGSEPSKPGKLTHKASHNIGFAVDTPQGLMVPVIHAVQSHTIASLAAELSRLGNLARNNKLSSADLSGATFTVSNIGAIGGTTLAPVIVCPQVAIVGVGKTRDVPAFAEDGSIVKKEETVFSWSADHRVVDGATVARCAEMVRAYLESPERMLVKLR